MSIDHSDARQRPTVERPAHDFFTQIADHDPSVFPISDYVLDYRSNEWKMPEER